MNYYLIIYIAVLIIYSYFCKQILIIINIMIISNISNYNISSIYNNVYTGGCFSTRNIYTKPLRPKVFDCIEISSKYGSVIQKQYYVRKSKSIIDVIDKLLAKHYSFTEEKLDFIINYDIKYRMGDELNEE